MDPIPFRQSGIPELRDSDPKGKSAEREMSFVEHLEELRWHLVRSMLAIGVFAVAAFAAKRLVFDYLIFAPKHPDFLSYRALCSASLQMNLGERLCIVPPEFTIANFSMMGEFMAHIQVSLILGLCCAFPFVLYEFWKFIRPGLYDKEISTTRGLVGWCSLLFAMGISFGYFIIVPFSINFLVPYSISDQVSDYIQLSDYIGFITMIVLAAGIMFELPVIIYFLASLGVISASFLRTYRRHAILIILALSAIITPPDALSQMLIAIPVMFLYEVGIWITVRIENRAAKAEDALQGGK